MRPYMLLNGALVQVDDEDFDAVVNKGPWHQHSKGYAYKTVKRDGKSTKLFMHRFSADRHKLGDGGIDHKDRDRNNNQSENLRLATRSQNGANIGLLSSNTSGFKGVQWHQRAGRWMAQIKVNQCKIYLGLIDCEIDAAIAYNLEAVKQFGEFACLNVIPEAA